jgi:glycosyltransferase involved in cell wall biosynthesis
VRIPYHAPFMNKITGTIPTYNPIKQWLQQTLDSISGFDELIICDDGSDNLNLDRYRFPKNIPNIFMRNDTNIGCFNTINRMCKEIKEGMITIQADDDYYNKETLLEIVNIARTTEADVVYFPCQYFGKYNFVFGNVPKVDYKTLLQSNYVYGSAFFRKELWQFLGGFQLEAAADWDFWVRAIKSGAKFIFYPSIGAYFRVTSRSMFEKSLSSIGREAINKLVYDNCTAWRGRYEKKKVFV